MLALVKKYKLISVVILLIGLALLPMPIAKNIHVGFLDKPGDTWYVYEAAALSFMVPMLWIDLSGIIGICAWVFWGSYKSKFWHATLSILATASIVSSVRLLLYDINDDSFMSLRCIAAYNFGWIIGPCLEFSLPDNQSMKGS